MQKVVSTVPGRTGTSGIFRILLVFLFVCTFPSVQAQITSTPIELAREIEKQIVAGRANNAAWGIRIQDLVTGEILFEREPHRALRPASNMKLFTSAAGLDRLGHNYRYRTELYARGPIVNGVLDGDLIVKGSGDPSIGGRFTDGDITLTFRQWADSLKAAGIRQITGRVIGDDDIFDDEALGYGWNPRDFKFWYSAEMSGLVLNDNCVDVTIRGTSRGSRAEVTWEPFNTDYVTIVNRTLTTRRGISEGYARQAGSNTITLSSRVGVNREDPESLTITNGTLFFAHVLRETLEKSEISVLGPAVDVDDISTKPNYKGSSIRRVATHLSPPLAEIVAVINKRSQNLYAEQLLKTLGAEEQPDGLPRLGTTRLGAQVVENFLKFSGIDTEGFHMADGSGLSRFNSITAAMTVEMLTYMWRHDDSEIGKAFFKSLSVAGEDGTLRTRMRGTEAAGNVFAKTGYIANTRTLSGYVYTAMGTPLAFSILCNDYPVSTNQINRIQDNIVALLANFRR